MKTRLMCVGVLSVIFGWLGIASDGDYHRTSQDFKGMRKIGIVVENIPGLTKDQVMADVSLKLHKAGLVVTHDRNCAIPTLHMRLERQVGAAGVLRSEIHQCSMLSPNEGFSIAPEAIIWESTEPVAGNSGARDIRDKATRQADLFLNAWISANPK